MKSQILSLLLVVNLLSACEKKEELAPDASQTTAATPEPSVTTTTVTMVGTVASDAGADGGDAGLTEVAVSVTKIAVRGNAGVVEGIASARCQREQRCGNIGAEKDHHTLDACLAKVATDWRDDLNRYECPGGVDQKELAECLDEIRNEDCKNPFDKLERIVACRTADLCISKR